MKHELPTSADLVPLSPVVTILECPGALRINPGPLSDLFVQKGEKLAEQTVSRVLEDLSGRIQELQGPRLRSSFIELDGPADRVANIADQIGLTEVADAARHTATAARQADGIAVEATISRLERAFDAAISQVWNFHVFV